MKIKLSIRYIFNINFYDNLRIFYYKEWHFYEQDYVFEISFKGFRTTIVLCYAKQSFGSILNFAKFLQRNLMIAEIVHSRMI